MVTNVGTMHRTAANLNKLHQQQQHAFLSKVEPTGTVKSESQCRGIGPVRVSVRGQAIQSKMERTAPGMTGTRAVVESVPTPVAMTRWRGEKQCVLELADWTSMVHLWLSGLKAAFKRYVEV